MILDFMYGLCRIVCLNLKSISLPCPFTNITSVHKLVLNVIINYACPSVFCNTVQSNVCKHYLFLTCRLFSTLITTCVYRQCMSPTCYAEIYARDILEEGEIDVRNAANQSYRRLCFGQCKNMRCAIFLLEKTWLTMFFGYVFFTYEGSRIYIFFFHYIQSVLDKFFMYCLQHCFICRPFEVAGSDGLLKRLHRRSDSLSTRLDLIHWVDEIHIYCKT